MCKWLLLGLLLAAYVAPASAINLFPEAQQLTATAGGAAIGNTDAAIITTGSLTTAGGSSATFTFSSGAITPNSLPMVTVGNGTNSAGFPAVETATPGNGILTIVIFNDAASTAFNGTLKIYVVIYN